MDIDGASILVTGGAGLVGSTTIEQLLRLHDPARVVIFDNLVRGSHENIEPCLRDRRVEFVVGDIRDVDALARSMRGIDAVFHMAALRITACAAEPREAVDVMCTGSFNVVEAARAAGVRKLVAASSASVYGLADSFPTAESQHPYHDDTLYGATKVFLEGLLRSYRAMHGLDYVALRYFNVYGPKMDLHGKYTEVLVRWMDRIAAGDPPLILGDGQQTMDFVYIDDIARANVKALASGVSGEVFNIATGVETSLATLAHTLMRVMGCELELEYGPQRSVNSVPRRLADTRKARRLLGFEAEVGLEEGLARLVHWWTERSREAVAVQA